MATLTNSDINSGVIIYDRGDYPEAKLVLEDGTTVSKGDLISITGKYTSEGATTTTTIFKGRIVDKNFEKVKTVMCEDECESDIDKPIEADYYCGRLGGLVQELLDHECAFITHDFTQTSPYNYRAPQNFRNIANGSPPDSAYWDNIVTSGTGTVQIIASLSGHKKVCEMNCGTGVAQVARTGLNRYYDEIEFWIRLDQSNKRWQIQLDDDDGSGVSDGSASPQSGIRLRFDTDGNIKYLDGYYTSSSWVTIQAYSADIWYKIKISYGVWNSDEQGPSDDKWNLWINDVKKSGTGWDLYGINPLSSHEVGIMQNLYFTTVTAAGIGYLDAYGSVFDGNYILGINATQEYNELLYTTEFFKYPMTEKTNRQYFNAYALKHTKIWYLDPDYLIHINDGDVDSQIDIGASSNVTNVDGKKQVKAIDKVVIKGGMVNGVRLIGTYGTGDVLAKDTHAHILDQDDLDDMALQVYNQQSAGILQVALDYENVDKGYIQVGEEVTIVGNTIKFKKSEDYIATSNTQFKIRSVRVHLGPNAVILYIELYLDDVLLFQITETEGTQKATEENSQLISEVGSQGAAPASGGGTGSGEANTGANVGEGEGLIYKEKIGVTLKFKSLKEGSGIGITNNAEDITLASDVGDFLENPPTENEANKAATSEWSFDHDADGNAHHNEAHILGTSGPHTGTLPWDELNKTGSDLVDLASRTHSDLSDAPTNAHHDEDHILGTSGPHTGALPLIDLEVGTRGDIIRRSIADWDRLPITPNAGNAYYALRNNGTDVVWAETVSNDEYDGLSWNGVLSVAPSKNAVRDVIDPLTSSLKYSGVWTPGIDKYPEAQVDDVDGSTNVASPTIFTDANADFSTAGVLVNDILNIREGTDEGFYVITAVGTTTVTCSAASFSTATALEYQIFRAIGGEYWICDADGFYDNVWYEVGDWLIWNDTEIQWDRIRNSFGDNIIAVAPGDSIQAAIDEIESIGEGTIRLLAGTHVTTAALQIDNGSVNLIIEGMGFSTIVQPNSTHHGFEMLDAESLIIRDLSIDCVNHTNTTEQGVRLFPSAYPTFSADKMILERLYIYGSGDTNIGIQITGMHGAVVRDCIIEDSFYGIITNADRNIFNGNVFESCGTGIYFNLNADYCLVIGNVFKACTTGITVWGGSSYNVLAGNVFEGCSTNINNLDSTTIILGDDTVYGSGWNGKLATPTKNAVYDKINAMVEGGAGTDITAIHEDVGDEITAITLKITPVDADELIIEDSEASYAKKSITIGSLPFPSVPTLDQAFDAGKIINGANSAANAVQIGNGSNEFKMYAVGNATYIDSDTYFYIRTTYSFGVIYFIQNGTTRWEIGAVGLYPGAGNTYDIGSASRDVRYLYYCNMSDTSCADFSHLTAEELYQLFKQIKPRTDNIKHRIESGMLFNHIDFATVPDEFATKAKEDFTKENVYTDIGKTTIDYKKGDVCGLEKGTWDYAIKDLLVKQYELIKSLEARIEKLENPEKEV